MMYYLTTTPTLTASDCLVIGVFTKENWPSFALNINKAHHDILNRLRKKLKNPGDIVWQTELDGHSLCLVHCGEETDYHANNVTRYLSSITQRLLQEKITSATICLPQQQQHTADEQVQHMLLQMDADCYQLLDFKTTNKKQNTLQSVYFFQPNAEETALHDAEAIAQSIRFTRTLADMPANICSPTYLSQQALTLAKSHNTLQCRVLERDDMQQLGMGALLAVAQGSNEPPKLIEIQYQGASPKDAPVVLVGKGITFDSGGLSLKPADAMPEMKYDMAGAASVLGTLQACALLKLPINVVGLLACAENLPSGSAVKPGDIVTSLSGQTVEIINTDAEGRLVLADALTYAERFHPRFVIDIATLTGAVIVALGHVASGFMTEDETLATLITHAATTSQDKAWRLPLSADYQEALDSPLADMLNATFDRTAGSVTAACFLSRFTKNYPWAHLDVAGTAWVSGKKRIATGRPVPLLIELLRHVAR